MEKELARQLQSSYIPGGPSVDPKNLDWRETADDDVLRCGVATGNDIQSGPLYCGRVADFKAFTEKSICAVCRRHFRRMGLEVREEA